MKPARQDLRSESEIKTPIFATLLGFIITLTTGTPAHAGTIVGVTTPAPNNYDYTGTFPGPNVRSTLNATGFNSLPDVRSNLNATGFDVVISVAPSGGTTEYSFRLAAILDRPDQCDLRRIGLRHGQ